MDFVHDVASVFEFVPEDWDGGGEMAHAKLAQRQLAHHFHAQRAHSAIGAGQSGSTSLQSPQLGAILEGVSTYRWPGREAELAEVHAQAVSLGEQGPELLLRLDVIGIVKVIGEWIRTARIQKRVCGQVRSSV